MELGNLIFGNSRGEYPFPRGEGYEEIFYNLVKIAGEKYENETFMIFPYYWGDCSCGWDKIDNGHSELYKLKHNEDCYINEYNKLYNLKLDNKDYLNELKILYKKYNFNIEKTNKWWYGCATKCSCDYEERENKILDNYFKEFGNEGHKPDCFLLKSNFLYKPTGFSIKWYKYPFRDSYTNKEINLLDFKKMINSCINSLRKNSDIDPYGEEI